MKREKMRSPIFHLKQSIEGVPYQIAPENSDKCRQNTDMLGITIEFNDDSQFAIRVNLNTNIIKLPIASLEYLWSFSHFSWVLYQEYRNAQLDNAKEFDCRGSSRLRNAFLLVKWAKDNMLSTGTEAWPNDLPTPQKDPEDYSDIHIANELFLCSLGWMLHHEIGHIVLQHSFTTFNSAQEEKDADNFATDWILSKLEQDSPMLEKRALGIAVGVLCLQSLEVSKKSSPNNTYPETHDRIYSCLSRYQVGDDEIIEAFSSAVLQYLFHDDEKIAIDVNEDSFSTIWRNVLFDISRSKRS